MINQYPPFDTVISNRALFPGFPVSLIVMLVIEKISRAGYRQMLLFLRFEGIPYAAREKCPYSDAASRSASDLDEQQTSKKIRVI